jgi:hypothetical protein
MKQIFAAALCLLAIALCACAKEELPDSSGMMAAVFEGMADSHTIEAYVGGELVAFQLTGDALAQADSFEKGDEVYIRYERKDGVLYALSIEEAPPAQ